MKYLCFVLCLQISFKECTIDISINELVYIADHLKAADCRLLFASLYFSSHGLPAKLFEAARLIPRDIPCIKLLTKWNSGAEAWEGKGKTHALIERRLRQIGKWDLAEWLGKKVFHQLANEVNSSLEEYEIRFEEDKPVKIPLKVFKDSELSKFDGEEWTTIDSILSVTLFAMLFITLAAFCRMLRLSFGRAKVKRNSRKNGEELVDLMSAESLESDQETLYELDVENRKRSRVNFEDDPRKSSSGGSDNI